MLSAAAIALAVAALAAGLTGTWSPCGFSMIDTLGPRGHDGGRRATWTACAMFALGAPVGGVITFGGLSALGALLQGGGGDRGSNASAHLSRCLIPTHPHQHHHHHRHRHHRRYDNGRHYDARSLRLHS